jgi:hypothetical protein
MKWDIQGRRGPLLERFMVLMQVPGLHHIHLHIHISLMPPVLLVNEKIEFQGTIICSRHDASKWSEPGFEPKPDSKSFCTTHIAYHSTPTPTLNLDQIQVLCMLGKHSITKLHPQSNLPSFLGEERKYFKSH